jgi:hypothetical protein
MYSTYFVTKDRKLYTHYDHLSLDEAFHSIDMLLKSIYVRRYDPQDAVQLFEENKVVKFSFFTALTDMIIIGPNDINLTSELLNKNLNIIVELRT